MFKNVAEWFAALRAWLTGSTPSPTQEAIETLLDNNRIRAFYNVAEAHMRTGRGRFPQILRGGTVPSDRGDQKAFVPGLPPGLTDYRVDEWEGPSGKGWALTVFCMDAGQEWQLRISSDKGVEGWTQTPQPLPVP